MTDSCELLRGPAGFSWCCNGLQTFALRSKTKKQLTFQAAYLRDGADILTRDGGFIGLFCFIFSLFTPPLALFAQQSRGKQHVFLTQLCLRRAECAEDGGLC